MELTYHPEHNVAYIRLKDKGDQVETIRVSVEMKQKAQEKIRAELEGKSIEEQLAYWDRHAQRLREQRESARSVKKSA